MTDFQNIVRKAARMCNAHEDCSDCPMVQTFEAFSSCPFCVLAKADKKTIADAERIAEVWDFTHPEPKYPTWAEWVAKTFPNGSGDVCPCVFDGRFCTDDDQCGVCISRPIPADIAEKLGIKPVEVAK